MKIEIVGDLVKRLLELSQDAPIVAGTHAHSGPVVVATSEYDRRVFISVEIVPRCRARSPNGARCMLPPHDGTTPCRFK